MQQVSTVAARIIVDEMRKLYIYDIPGEDVKVLTSTLFEYCRRLEGVQTMSFDLAGIVAACFLKSATMGFNMEMQTIYKQAIANMVTWQQVLTMVGTEYQTLLGNGLWEAKIIKPELYLLQYQVVVPSTGVHNNIMAQHQKSWHTTWYQVDPIPGSRST